MPVSFPLDKIPALPNQAVALIVDQIVKFINKIQLEIEKVISDCAKLPDDCNCDSPDIQDLLERIRQIQELVQKILQLVPLIEKIVNLLKTLVGIANAIKALQLLNPITALPVLAAELVIVQNMILANAGIAVKQLGTIPPQIRTSLESALGGLGDVAVQIGRVCGDEVSINATNSLRNAIDNLDFSDSIPEKQPAGSWLLIQGSGNNGSPLNPPPNPKSPYNDTDGSIWIWDGEIDPGTGIAWGSEQSRKDDETMGSEFYTEINTGIEDIKSRIGLIESLVDTQQDLLKSLQEAPAQSYNGEGAPKISVGKPGDYYVDTKNKNIYGPKTSSGWPTPVNF